MPSHYVVTPPKSVPPMSYVASRKAEFAARHGSGVDSARLREAIGDLKTWIAQDKQDEDQRPAQVVVVRNTLTAMVQGEYYANASKDLTKLPAMAHFGYFRVKAEVAADPANAPRQVKGRDSTERLAVIAAINALADWMQKGHDDLEVQMQEVESIMDVVLGGDGVVRIPAGMQPPEIAGVNYGSDGRSAAVPAAPSHGIVGFGMFGSVLYAQRI